jgi:hypothetical protein
MFPVMYELGIYVPEDRILHSHRRENLESLRDPHFLPRPNYFSIIFKEEAQ